MAAAWRDVSHALRDFYLFADVLIVLDAVLCFEISSLARQLKFNPDEGDGVPVISQLTASLWFRSMDLTITGSTSSARGPINDRKQLKSMWYRLTQDG